MHAEALGVFAEALESIRSAGLEKTERTLLGPQGAAIRVRESPAQVLNFCANNYLGLSSDPAIVHAAREALDAYGYGLSSVRFICGTQSIHHALEAKIAAFLGVDD